MWTWLRELFSGPHKIAGVDAKPNRKSRAVSQLREAELVIGLDFGSGFTKCVIRDPDLDFAVAVPVGGARHAYVAPSNPEGFGSLKLRLVRAIQEHGGDEIPSTYEDALVKRLAYFLKRARTWFESEYDSRYRERRVLWSANLGIPVTMEQFGSSQLSQKFRRALHDAWLLSFRPADGTTVDGPRSLEQTGSHAELLNVWPEVGAEITAYIQSTHYRDGLHFLVDLGAGSVDVATFNLIGRERQAILATELSWAGVEVLTHHERPSELLDTFGTDLYEVLRSTKTAKDRTSRDWSGPLRTFWCGGGTARREYRERRDHLDRTLQDNWSQWHGFDVRRPVLPSTDALHAPGLEEDGYHRLSVAHGLSYRIDDMGTIIGPPPDAPPVRRIQYSPPGLEPLESLLD